MAARDTRTLVTEYIQAVGDKRFDHLAALLHPELQATRPSGNVLGRDQFIAGVRRLALILQRTDIRRILVEGAEAAVLYDLVTDTAAGATPATEWLTVEDGLIRESVVFLDWNRWSPAMDELASRERAAGVG